VIAEQADLLQGNLDQLYDNWFIETCEPWAVPYIADLIGVQPVGDVGDAGDAGNSSDAGARSAALLPRAEVANTLRYRRRKGTLALLELLAADLSGWPARAVELGALLRQTQSLRMPQPARGRSVDLRDGGSLADLGTAFSTAARTPDLRRLNSARLAGQFSPGNVGLFVWRLLACSITRSPAACQESVGPNCFTFSVLGNDTPLFNRPLTQTDPQAIAGRLNLPLAISRRALAAPAPPGQRFATANSNHYGLATAADGTVHAQSLAIWAPGWPPAATAKGTAIDESLPIPAERVIVADLSNWTYQPPRNHVAVDPVLGRIAFPARQVPRRLVAVSYHHGAVANIGGGEYPRPVSQHAHAKFIRVRGVDELREALKPWRREDDAQGNPGAPADQPDHAVIEIADSGVYTLPIQIFLGAGHSLQFRAAQRTRPVIQLLDWQVDRSDNFLVEGLAGSRLTIDGLLVSGRGLQVQGALGSLTLRHTTLVPGWSLEPNCDPKRPAEPSIEIIDSGACIVIVHSIVGSIQVNNDEVRTDPVELRISDSIVDATGSDCDSPQCEAIGAAGSRSAFVSLTLLRCTVIGKVMVHAVALAENSLLTSCLTVARRQIGCMRFCHVPAGSRTPRRFACQPDGAEAAVLRQGQARAAGRDEIAALQRQERQRVRPLFDSTRYGTPTYCRLAQGCATEIARGASDESEMGVHHDLYQPQRQASLAARLTEYTPAATDAGLVLAD